MSTDFKDTNWFKMALTNINPKTLKHNSKSPEHSSFPPKKKDRPFSAGLI
jgi:hypothetical protein